jgi:hypothetical protein
MKSTIGSLKRDLGQYNAKHFAAIRENGFSYYWSATEGVLMMFNGQWTPYNTVRKSIDTLPEVTYATA